MNGETESPAEWFGPIDIYLFDQLLRGRLRPGMRVLDAGCGTGRNIIYLLRGGYDVWAVDRDPAQVESVRRLAMDLAPRLPADRFRTAQLDELSFADGSFDFIICSAVLHFVPDEPSFDAIVRELWRVLAPGGVFFARLASTIGIEDRVRRLDGRRHALPDGSERFLVDEAMLLDRTRRLGGRLIDPLKTTVVQDLRAMTTWVLEKPQRLHQAADEPAGM